MRPWLPAVLATIVVGCGGTHKKVHSAGEVYLDDVVFVGNTAIPKSDLLGGLALSRQVGAPRDVDPFMVANDTERVKGAFLRLGYFNVEVTADAPLKKGDARIVTFNIKEGERAKVAGVSFRGLPADIPVAKARALVKLADGAPFDYEPYDDAKDTLIRLLFDSGYAHARLDATVSADKKHAEATLDYRIEPGPRCVFGDITIRGIPANALADAVRVRVAFHIGDTFSITALEKTQRALYGVGRFSTVQVVPDLGTGKDKEADAKISVIPVSIVVAEANRHEFRGGVGVGLDPLDYSIRGRAQYSQAGVFDPLTTFSIEFRPALTFLRDTSGDSNEFAPLIRLIGRLTRTDLFLPNVKGEAEGGLDFQTVEAYTQTGARARLGLSSPLGWDKLQGRIGWTFGLYTFSGISPAIDASTKAGLGLDQVERLGAYTQGLSLDLRDSALEPTSGLFASAQVAEGTKYAGGGFDFVSLSPELRGYLPLGGGFVLAARGHLATIIGDVPVTERLYGGGASSHRGFSERRLSPVAMAAQPDGSIATVVIGGTSLVETSLELRVPLGEYYVKFGGVFFLDGGDVTETASELDLGNLHWATGVGFRLFTPIGPFRVDVGYRLNRTGPNDPEPGTHINYFFGFGEAF